MLQARQGRFAGSFHLHKVRLLPAPKNILIFLRGRTVYVLPHLLKWLHDISAEQHRTSLRKPNGAQLRIHAPVRNEQPGLSGLSSRGSALTPAHPRLPGAVPKHSSRTIRAQLKTPQNTDEHR